MSFRLILAILLFSFGIENIIYLFPKRAIGEVGFLRDEKCRKISERKKGLTTKLYDEKKCHLLPNF